MTTSEYQQLRADFQAAVAASENRIMARIDDVRDEQAEVRKKLEEQQSFQAGLQGAAKIGLWILTAVGIIVGIYVGLHGIHSSPSTPGTP